MAKLQLQFHAEPVELLELARAWSRAHVGASRCYVATPNGHAGLTFTAGGGVGGPLSAGAFGGPMISNGQSLNDQRGPFVGGGASVGYRVFSGGAFGAVGKNSCGDTIWDAGVGWAPSIGLGPPVSIYGGKTNTWAAPGWLP